MSRQLGATFRCCMPTNKSNADHADNNRVPSFDKDITDIPAQDAQEPSSQDHEHYHMYSFTLPEAPYAELNIRHKSSLSYDKTDQASPSDDKKDEVNNEPTGSIANYSVSTYQGNSPPLPESTAENASVTSQGDYKANVNLYTAHGSDPVSDSANKNRSVSTVSTVSKDSGFVDNSRRGTMIASEKDEAAEYKPPETDGVEFVVGNSNTSGSNQEQLLAPLADESDELKIILAKLDKLSSTVSSAQLKRKRISLNNFAAAFLTGERGGIITIDQRNRRVSISVPPGALPIKDKPQLVYIYIPNQSQIPSTNGKSDEAWIAPNVRCGPSGLTFRKPVFLTIPYESYVDSTSMKIVGYQKKLSTGNKWNQLKEGEDAVTVSRQENVTLFLNHFCDYGCTGLSKWINALVLVKREETCTRHVFVHLFDINTELKVDDSCDSQAMEISDNGGSIQVNINEVCKSWKILKSSQEIEFSDMWFDHSTTSSDSVKFTAKLQNSDVGASSADMPNFSANVDIYQNNNHRPRTSLKVIDEDPNTRMRPLEISEIRKSMDAQFLQDYFDDSPYFVQQCRYTGICTLLDTAEESQGCWKKFGVEIGVSEIQTLRWIAKITKQSDHPSPAATLLDFYLQDACSDSEKDTLYKLRCLSNIFLKIDNHAAKKWVDEEISDRTTHVFERDLYDSPRSTTAQKTTMGHSTAFDDKACQVPDVLELVQTRPACPVKKKKTFRQKTKKRVSKMFGIKTEGAAHASSNNNQSAGTSNAAYKEDQTTEPSFPMFTDGNDNLTVPHIEVHSAHDSRKASKLSAMSKDSGFSSRPPSMAPSEISTLRPLSAASTTSTLRPLSAASTTSTLRPLSAASSTSTILYQPHQPNRPDSTISEDSAIRPDSAISEDSAIRPCSTLSSQLGSDGLHTIDEGMEEIDEDSESD
ncbi:uncharacterized protein [Amphiura filiformis]|uniref:uncharacterized protein n=1 Tax=Amphiura filiformis TaxID=82378 RepID=UPI003B212268